MISHNLSQIYNKMLINEASSIPDDVKTALMGQMNPVNRNFYKYNASDFAKLCSTSMIASDDLRRFSFTVIEYSCKLATHWYENITNAFIDALHGVLADVQKSRSWWGLASMCSSYIKYCQRFDKNENIVADFIVALMQPNNAEELEGIGKTDAMMHLIDQYMTLSKTFDGRIEAIIKHMIISHIEKHGSADVHTRTLISDVYNYYANTVNEPCEWIDKLVCQMEDDEEADMIFTRFMWIRQRITGASYYNLQDFRQAVC